MWALPTTREKYKGNQPPWKEDLSLPNNSNLQGLLQEYSRALPIWEVIKLLTTPLMPPYTWIFLESVYLKIYILLALPGVAQSVGNYSANRKFADSIPVRAHTWVASKVPGWGGMRDNWWMFLSNIDVSLLLFFPPLPCL